MELDVFVIKKKKNTYSPNVASFRLSLQYHLIHLLWVKLGLYRVLTFLGFYDWNRTNISDVDDASYAASNVQ